jgi:hypothetical protein
LLSVCSIAILKEMKARSEAALQKLSTNMRDSLCIAQLKCSGEIFGNLYLSLY